MTHRTDLPPVSPPAAAPGGPVFAAGRGSRGRRVRRLALLPCVASCLLLAACGGDAGTPEAAADDPYADEHAEMATGPTNRVDIPPPVRRNLGITFAAVEARRVEPTLRVPGRFEYEPTARREYRTMLPGRVTLLVDQFDRVDAGTPLYRIDAPGWRDLQEQITAADATIERLETRIASYGPLRRAHREHERQLARSIDIRRDRVRQLEQVAEAGGGRAAELAEARGALAELEASLAETLEKEARLEASEAEARADLAAAGARRDFLLETAASYARTTVADLEERSGGPQGTVPRWRLLRELTVIAEAPGTVEALGLTNGAWADEESAVLTVVQPDRLRFHATGLQSDLGRLREGLPCRIVAPAPTRRPGAIDLQDTMAGELRLGLSGDPEDRTLDLYVRPDELAGWARPGVSAQLEVVTDPAEAPTLAVPLAAIQRDGITPVFFRRDPDDANRAIRVEADLGPDDGRWVAVLSGLRLGDEVVLDGSYQLMLATQTLGGGMPSGGHFHADGTFHAEEH